MRGSRVEHHFEISLAIRSAIQPNWRYERLCQLRLRSAALGPEYTIWKSNPIAQCYEIFSTEVSSALILPM